MNRALTLACLLLAAASARADLITIVASGSLVNFSDPGGLLPFSQADAAGGFTFAVTYDDTATADLSADPNTGIYGSAVQSMQLTIGSKVIAPWSQKGVVLFNDRSGNGGLVISDLWGAQTLQTTPLGQNGDTRQTSFDLTFVKSATGSATSPPLVNDALVPPAWPYAWSVVGIHYRIDDYNAQHGLIGTPAIAESNVENLSITTSAVPLPATAWLLPAAFAAAGLRARRR